MRFLPGTARRPDAGFSLAQYRQRAARYDLELALFEPWRAATIARLELRRGDTVVDVGCGTGLSFVRLADAVGPRGQVVGIEPCPEMLAQARARVARHGWRHVALMQASAAEAPLQRGADALLFHFTHDVMRDADALGHVIAHARPGARVAACGLQWAPPWMVASNAFVLAAALYSTSSLEGLERPWDLLAQRLQDLQVTTAWTGGIYIASGRVARAPAH